MTLIEHLILHYISLQLCEQFGFLHESKGQGKERCIHVRKALEYASRPAAEVPDDTQTSEDVTNDSVDETQTRTSGRPLKNKNYYSIIMYNIILFQNCYYSTF